MRKCCLVSSVLAVAGTFAVGSSMAGAQSLVEGVRSPSAAQSSPSSAVGPRLDRAMAAAGGAARAVVAQSAPAAPQAAGAAPQPPKQSADGKMQVCGYEIGPPSKLPPTGSGPVLYQLVLCFAAQGGVSVVDPNTYLYYIHAPTSRPSENVWTPWDEKTEKAVFDDFRRLWGTTFLDNLSIETEDYTFSNGVVGKLVLYIMEERQRVKIVDFDVPHIERTKIDDKLKEEGVVIRLDEFLDPGKAKRVKNVLLGLLAEKGYQFAQVDTIIEPRPGGPKLVNLTFKVDEGPQVKIRDVAFVGNKAFSSFRLKGQMKNNRGRWFFSFITGHGAYLETKYEEDVEKLVAFYRDRGYVAIRIGEPELKFIEDSSDRKTRWVQLRIPVNEGPRYRIGNFSFDGNKVVRAELLRPLFAKVKVGDWYSDKAVRKGLEKAREVYGQGGYYEFTGYPDLLPTEEKARLEAEAKAASGDAPAGAQPADAPHAKAGASPPAGATPAEVKPASAKPSDAKARPARPSAPSIDVTMRIQEGTQYFVNRIVFTGNTTTRDTVVRREMRLFEEGIFDTEALKFSIRRINQLAYFRPLEGGKDVDVQKTPNIDNKVDVTLKFEEQNRNQLTFGAGVSQFEGFFGQLGFQTANFLGRGETFSVNLQAGSRVQNYQVAFTEPYLFDRAITGGIDIYKRRIEYISQFTQDSVGGNIVFGFPLRNFTRFFVNYSYERARVTDVNSYLSDPDVMAASPYLAYLLTSRTVSKITPSLVHNTVDNPIFPTSGRRYTVSVDLAGVGGDTNFVKPVVEGVWYVPHTKRTSFGFRGQLVFVAPFTSDQVLPIYERLALGGEYSVRGFDIRSIGPRTEDGLVIGGNKSLLFNAEYLINIAGPVRLVLFFDAGQVRDQGEKFAMNQFKTSTGGEVRFFMPVLNVPFRLIFAYDPHRSGILDNSGQFQSAFSFRFAVGSTF